MVVADKPFALSGAVRCGVALGLALVLPFCCKQPECPNARLFVISGCVHFRLLLHSFSSLALDYYFV